ncbi:hypothetical protein PO909_023048 [Leuciscus waleckii]
MCAVEESCAVTLLRSDEDQEHGHDCHKSWKKCDRTHIQFPQVQKILTLLLGVAHGLDPASLQKAVGRGFTLLSSQSVSNALFSSCLYEAPPSEKHTVL